MNEENMELLSAYIYKIKSEIKNDEFFAEMIYEFHYILKCSEGII